MDWNSISRALIIAAAMSVAWHLRRIGLHRLLPIFFFTWIFTFCRSALLWILVPYRDPYFRVWLYTHPLFWVLDAAVVYEIYRLALRRYAGVRRLAYSILSVGVVLSVLLAYAGSPRLAYSYNAGWYIRMAKTIGGGVDLALVLLTLVAIGFLWYFPIPLNRNFAIHIQIYTIYYLGSAVLDWTIASYGLQKVPLAMVLRPLLTVVMCSLWIVFLRTPSEEQVPIHSFSAEKERELMAQLNSIDSGLRGLARK